MDKIIDFIKRLLLLDKLGNSNKKENEYTDTSFYQKYKINNKNNSKEQYIKNKETKENIETKVLEILNSTPEKMFSLNIAELEKINNTLKVRINSLESKINK